MSQAQPSTEEQGGNVTLMLSLMGKDVSAESALLADLYRRGMKTEGAVDVTSPDLGSGIYWTDNGVFVKFLSSATTPPVQSSPPSNRTSARDATIVQTGSRETQSSSPSRYRYDTAASNRVEQGRLVPPLSSHAPRPAGSNPVQGVPLPYQSQSVLPTQFTVVPLLVDPPSGEAYGYTMEVILAYLIKRDPPEFDMSYANDSPGDPLVFKLTVDTGGGVDSWIFSILPQEQFSHVGTAPLPSNVEELRRKKNKIGHPPTPAVADNVTQLNYGYPTSELSSAVEVEQTLVNLGSWDTRKECIKYLAKDFPIGAVQGADGNVFARQADGLLALGRWSDASRLTGHKQTGTWTSKITTLPGALYGAGHIQLERFGIRIAHPTLDHPGSFICFGLFRDPSAKLSPPGCFRPGATWQSLECSYKDASGQQAWTLNLRRITIYIPDDASFSPVHIEVNAHVILDTGSAHTFLPQASIEVLDKYLVDINAHHTGIASNIPATARISFTFKDGTEGGNTDVYFTGQAIRFLVNPLKSAVRKQGNPACNYAAPGSNGPYLLGLNFFRTFCVDFGESDIAPWVRMIPQKDVAHR